MQKRRVGRERQIAGNAPGHASAGSHPPTLCCGVLEAAIRGMKTDATAAPRDLCQPGSRLRRPGSGARSLFRDRCHGRPRNFLSPATGAIRISAAESSRNLLIETYRIGACRRAQTSRSARDSHEQRHPCGNGLRFVGGGAPGRRRTRRPFGGLGWDPARIVEQAARLEGHPDNVAACWHGGLTHRRQPCAAIHHRSIQPPPGWQALLVLPDTPVATSKARSVLAPELSTSRT